VYLRREEHLTVAMAAPDMRCWDWLMRARWHFWRTSREHIAHAQRCLLAFKGRTKEAVEYVLQAIDASPQDPHLSLWIRTRAIACFIDEDYVGATRYAIQATAKRPDWFFNYYLCAAC
jgi:hypothetical protein